MYLYTTHSIGDTVYYVSDESTVKRAKITRITISRPQDSKSQEDKNEVEYWLMDFHGVADAIMEEELFCTASEAFRSLEPKVEYADEPVDYGPGIAQAVQYVEETQTCEAVPYD